MDRRNFLKTTGSLVSATAFSGAGLKAATRTVADRSVLPLNRNWLYSRTPVDGAHEKDFDDSGFERVVLPHANIRLPWHSFEDKAYQFVSVYRRHFRVPPAARGRRVFVDFEGVMTASTVWLNGVRLGEYRGGFTPFGFDLTPHVDHEGENVLVVEVDSTERPDIPPFGHLLDYMTFGGIYREVSLKLVASSFLENVFARPMNVTLDRAGLEVDCFIQHLEAAWPDLVLELDFYTRTNRTAHELDPTRHTGGIRAFRDSELLEDVFTLNDFGFPLQAPSHPRYLNTEFIGHTYDTKTTDDADRLIEHTLRHARVHDQLASDPRYAGGIAWCAFDYNTHASFGSGDRICYHGVADIFREPKRAAGFYRSQCDPAEEVVVEPALHWAPGDEAGGLSRIVVCSNCDHLKLFVRGKLLVEGGPDRKQFPRLAHPPFVFTEMRVDIVENWGDLRIEGYIGDRQVIVRTWSGLGVDQQFELTPDDPTLLADGADSTRLVLRVTDEFGNVRPYAADVIPLELDGPAELIGENPCLLVGGIAAVWIRATEKPGTVRIKAIHARLGERSIRIEILPAPAETV